MASSRHGGKHSWTPTCKRNVNFQPWKSTLLNPCPYPRDRVPSSVVQPSEWDQPVPPDKLFPTQQPDRLWKYKSGPIPPLLKTQHQLPSHLEWEPKSFPQPTRSLLSSGPDHYSRLFALPPHLALNQPHGLLRSSANKQGIFLPWGLCSDCPLCWNALPWYQLHFPVLYQWPSLVISLLFWVYVF